MSEHIIWLPYAQPPLNANAMRRMHWRKERQISRGLRSNAHLRARSLNVPKGVPFCTVELHYVPATRRTRDSDNLWPTLKPLCDGLVDYGLVKDDTPDMMAKPAPIIDEVSKTLPGPMKSRLYLVVKIPGSDDDA